MHGRITALMHEHQSMLMYCCLIRTYVYLSIISQVYHGRLVRATRGSRAPSAEANSKLDAMAVALSLTQQQLATIHDITCSGTYKGAVAAALAAAAGEDLQVYSSVYAYQDICLYTYTYL
jgi:hypothetical protein